MGERKKLERRDERVRREENGERREKGWEKGEWDTLSILQTCPNTA